MSTHLFASSYKPEPFWWERSPLCAEPEPALPASADVVIIGSGYTGLCAAIQTARGGRHTVVIEANAIGSGCSSRNGGQVRRVTGQLLRQQDRPAGPGPERRR
jgi:monoamine oxidase